MKARSDIRPAVLRCAVYTRKSSEEGLEQSFNSLHAQRDACESYVRSQISEGWSCLPKAYDDGGISGGTMERPGLKALLADIATGNIDVVVVYKVDRLTRSLMDFSRIIEAFDKAGVSFVSVTQAFNTTTSMGRLTLNVLLSFAQFEREVTGERIRDKIALSKAKGMWMGGYAPLGYDRGDHVLLVNEVEAETVRAIYQRYLELGSVHTLCTELKATGVRSKRYVTTAGKVMGNAALSRGALFYLLKNRHYLGEIPHKGQNHPGLHPAIIDRELFVAVQAKLEENRVTRRKRSVKAASHLLTGRVFDGERRRFSPTFSTGRTGRIHRYYVLTDIQLGREGELHPKAIRRVGAEALEAFVLDQLRRLTNRPSLGAEGLLALLRRVELRPCDTHLILDRAAFIGPDHPELALQDLDGRLAAGERLVMEDAGETLRVALPRRMELRGGRSWTTFVGTAPTTPTVDAALVDALQRSHLLIADWRYADDSAYRRRLRRLAYLSPAVQGQILDGGLPRGVGCSDILNADPPLRWSEQAAWIAGLAGSQA